LAATLAGGDGGGGESFPGCPRVYWVAVPQALRARRANRGTSAGGMAAAVYEPGAAGVHRALPHVLSAQWPAPGQPRRRPRAAHPPWRPCRGPWPGRVARVHWGGARRGTRGRSCPQACLCTNTSLWPQPSGLHFAARALWPPHTPVLTAGGGREAGDLRPHGAVRDRP
jgi:hypothetical protein